MREKGVSSMTTINNLPTYATDYRFVVAREVDGDFWFWGAYSTRQKAEQVAEEIGGTVVEDFM